MHDILPEEQKYWRYVIKKAESLAEDYSFEKIDTPIVEQTELFVKSEGQTTDVVEKEILAADRQLTEKNLNALKIFAYPYGEVSDIAKKTLESSGYKLAFTTRTGSILCKKLRFELPRVRPENSPLSSYGF